MKSCLGCVLLLFASSLALSDDDDWANEKMRAEKLRGSIGAGREWWNVQHYDLSVAFDIENKQIFGTNSIEFRTVKPGKRMQIDLQPPLEISKVEFQDQELSFEREGNVYWVDFKEEVAADTEAELKIHYGGTPVEGKRPPWQGGLTWTKDENDNPFVVTTCQGIGASIWWPNKDHGADEPDRGMDIRLTVREDLSAVSNGRLKSVEKNEDDGTRTFHWSVVNPINNYCVNANIGKYVNFSDKFQGEFGELDLDYWVLEGQREKAMKHFREAPRTIEAFEHWFGKYPFYEDSYKLVVVPYPGMEHQSSVTYGNGFKNGFGARGDLSGTGVGMKFDFIIVHESGHEWFGNNVSMQDAADMWIHEGFTNYSENLFIEFHFSKEEAQTYVIGCRKLIRNTTPIIGEYGLNREGSGDMYYKGGNMLHTMRHILNDDEKWRAILRGINKKFWHQTVTTQQIEGYINEQSGIDYTKFFDQYLRDVRIPKLEYAIDGNKLDYHFANIVDGFSYPALLRVNGKEQRLMVTSEKQTFSSEKPIEKIELDRNFYYEFVDGAKDKTKSEN